MVVPPCSVITEYNYNAYIKKKITDIDAFRYIRKFSLLENIKIQIEYYLNF